MKKCLMLLTLLVLVFRTAFALNAVQVPSSAENQDVMTQIRALQEQARQAALHCEGDERVAQIYEQINSLYGTFPHNERGSLDQGGENCFSATPIGAIPYCDFGTTVGAVNDYTPPPACGTSSAPDVVYSYFSPINQTVGISLCGSGYNTILHVWEGCPGPAPSQVVCCNDDGATCAPQSCCPSVFLRAGATYYIVVDGAGTSAGNYILHIGPQNDCSSATCACVVNCPPGATAEGEGCPPGNPDNYNAGCFWYPFNATPLACGQTICASSYWDNVYQDHDAYIVTITSRDSLRWCVYAEFDVQIDVHQYFTAG